MGPEGEQLGVMLRREALETAYSLNLDLFCVAPSGQPPVCKILDYGRYKFDLQKKNKEAKKRQHVTELKPIRLSPSLISMILIQAESSQRLARRWQEG